MIRGGALLTVVMLAASGAWGCQGDAPPPLDAPQEPEGVLPAPGADPVLPDPVGPEEPDVPEPVELRTLRADTVQGWTGPGSRPFEVTLRTPGRASHLYRQIGRETFPLPARISNLTLIQYPCTSCHEGAVVMADRVQDAHHNIQPEHPQATGSRCATCHVSDSVQRLLLHDEQTVSMDHAYRLCAQCHSPETRSWAAGVHGKRLEGWHGRRIVMNCTDCHNPHRPAVARRIPFPAPRMPGAGGGSP